MASLEGIRPLAAESASAEQARKLYQQGVALSDQGEFEAALDAFERAYQTQPHPAVLFNIGQLQYSLGMVIPAKQSLERYLREAGTAKSSETVAQANRTLRHCNSRIGSLKLTLSPVDAQVYLDGEALADAARVVPLPSGSHSVVATRAGYQPAVSTFKVEGGSIAAIDLSLTPNGGPIGWLKLECPVPDVAVYLNNVPLNNATWLRLIPIDHDSTVLWVRAGYPWQRHEVRASPGRVVAVDCNLRPLKHMAAQQRGALVLHTDPEQAEIFVDGAPYDQPVLPVGRHRVEARCTGYLTRRQEVVVNPGETQTLEISLEMTPDMRRRVESRAQRQQNWAYAVGIGGLALQAGALTAFVVNHDRYESWKQDRDQVSAGGSDPTRWSALAERAASIQRVDDLALLGAAAGTALLTTSIYWLISGPNSSSR